MNAMAERLARARENQGMSMEDAAAGLGVSLQLLKNWEMGTEEPGIEWLPALSSMYRITTDWILTGQLPSARVLQVTEHLSNRFFDENKMYTYVGAYANAKEMYQTKKALSFAREKHLGQFRKEREGEKVPYIYHPLIMACHALALGMDEDALIAAILLHDVCEDCGVAPEDLPVGEEAREAVRLVTKPEDYQKTAEYEERYYRGISGNRLASLVKLLDRCHNVSGMAACFEDDKMAAYIMETEKYLYPISKQISNEYPEYSDQLFLIKYHMYSVIETLRHYMKVKM